MKLSTDFTDFKGKLDHLHPRYGETAALKFIGLNDDEEPEGL